MIPTLVYAVLMIGICGMLAWGCTHLDLPITAPFARLIQGVIFVVCVLMLLRLFGVLGAVPVIH